MMASAFCGIFLCLLSGIASGCWVFYKLEPKWYKTWWAFPLTILLMFICIGFIPTAMFTLMCGGSLW